MTAESSPHSLDRGDWSFFKDDEVIKGQIGSVLREARKNMSNAEAGRFFEMNRSEAAAAISGYLSNAGLPGTVIVVGDSDPKTKERKGDGSVISPKTGEWIDFKVTI